MDNINGVSIKDCVSVSRNIEHNLDREKEDFELSVSSPGLDQPFVVQTIFKKYWEKNSAITKENIKIVGELIKADREEISIKEIYKVKTQLLRKRNN